MAEYIEREAAIKRFNFAVLDCLGMEPTIRAGDIIKALESIPTADVRPVVRGKWERTSKSLYACSECGNCVVDERIAGMFYCPSCGAMMEASDGKD